MGIRILAVAVVVVSFAAGLPHAQSYMQATPPPDATAENQNWYLSGRPIAFGSGVYYPSGPVMHFSRNEMVPAGTFENVTIYIRTTAERGSVIFVPLAGGLVRPYERRRTGDLAGTVGSTAPSFPVTQPGVTAPPPDILTSYVEAPPDPLRPTAMDARTVPLMSVPPTTPTPLIAETAGTTGSLPVVRVPGPLQTARKPTGLNTVYLHYDNARWFLAGPAIEFASDRFRQVGEYRGFPVYSDPGQRDTIYVALVNGAPGLLTPYRMR
jgi:hypothetical protein